MRHASCVCDTFNLCIRLEDLLYFWEGLLRNKVFPFFGSLLSVPHPGCLDENLIIIVLLNRITLDTDRHTDAQKDRQTSASCY